nr:hypothetical protein [Tanacetum cinerariifolium]
NPYGGRTFRPNKIEDVALTYHNISLSSREIPSVDEPEPQLLPNSSPLDVDLEDKKGTDPPINPYSMGSLWSKVVDQLTIHTSPSPHMAYYHSEGYAYLMLCDELDRRGTPTLCCVVNWIRGVHLPRAVCEIYSILLTSMCCDDVYRVTSHVFTLVGCDRLVSEPEDLEEDPFEVEPLEEPKEEG